ncbi:MAG: aminotransferase class V-fold PLP-dependent enzyme [Bdellovibrionales bacterium]|nr:aminotransferase class V-fold PLP-dependent enzyme [Bdellovibrionales bacterium]
MSLEYKKQFNLPEDITYLNAAYMGPLLKQSADLAKKSIDLKSHPWEITPEDFFDPIEKARHLIAQILKCKPDNIALIPSASYGIATAMKNLKDLPSGEIIVIEEQFPSNYYSWSELAIEDGHKLISVKRDMKINMTEAVLDSINDQTRIIAMPYVHWCDGQKFDLALISEKAQKYGAKLVIDGTQSTGAVHLDLDKVKPDYYITATYKWMLSPYTMGFMYIDEKNWNGKPLEHNWINKLDAQNLSGLVNYKHDYQEGARRFDMGEKSQFHNMTAFIAALEFIETTGVDTINKHCKELTNLIIKNIEDKDHKFYYWPSSQRSEHILGLYFKEQNQLEMTKQKLQNNNVHVSYRGQAMRISPHIYNTEEDIQRLCYDL